MVSSSTVVPIDVLDPAGVEIVGQRLLGGHAHHVEPQRLAAAVLDAEHRLRRVVEREAVRRHEGEAEPRMQEAASAHEAFARILAVEHAVDAGEIDRAVALAGAGPAELAGVDLGVAHALGRRRMRRQEIGHARHRWRAGSRGEDRPAVPARTGTGPRRTDRSRRARRCRRRCRPLPIPASARRWRARSSTLPAQAHACPDRRRRNCRTRGRPARPVARGPRASPHGCAITCAISCDSTEASSEVSLASEIRPRVT